MKILALLASGALLASMTAMAGQTTSFSDLDKNGDGAVDEQEAREHDKLAERFDKADRDDDGELSQQEFTYAMARIRMEGDSRQSG